MGKSEAILPLTRDQLDTGLLVGLVRRSTAGGIATFEGTVRAEEGAGGKKLAALDYSAFEEMAAELMQSLCAKATAKFGLMEAVVVHRLGRVPLGEASVSVVTVAGHRAEALEACRWLIDAIKVDVPIWKKEVWDDGTVTWSDVLKS